MRPIQYKKSASEHEGKDILLYVEDDDANWRVALSGLSKDYRVVRARDAREACQCVRDLQGTIYAVLMDIELQGSDLNGVQLTRLFRQGATGASWPDYTHDLPIVEAPVLFVTAYRDTLSADEMRTTGAAEVIAKPVNFFELMRVLTTIHLKSFNSAMTSFE